MSTKEKQQEESILKSLAVMPPDEKDTFIDIVEFVARHPGSWRLLREARIKKMEDLSEVLLYLIDNWVDPEPLH